MRTKSRKSDTGSINWLLVRMLLELPAMLLNLRNGKSVTLPQKGMK